MSSTLGCPAATFDVTCTLPFAPKARLCSWQPRSITCLGSYIVSEIQKNAQGKRIC
jgi:hypothetical protein